MNMKKVLIILLLCVVGCLTGCGTAKLDQATVISDLESSVINHYEIGGEIQVFNINSCEIIPQNEDKKNRELEVQVSMGNSDYEVKAEYILFYSLNDQSGKWSLETYDENNINITPLRGYCRSDLDEILSNYATICNKDNVEISGITHSFYQSTNTDVITANYKETDTYYTVAGQIKLTASFRDNNWSYKVSDIEKSIGDEKWNYDELIGIWQIDTFDLAAEFNIISIDADNGTVVYQYKTAWGGLQGKGLDYLAEEEYNDVSEEHLKIYRKDKYGYSSENGEPELLLASCSKSNGGISLTVSLLVSGEKVYDTTGTKTYTAKKISPQYDR